MWTKYLTNWAISLLIISIVALSSSWLSVTRSVVRNTSLVIGISLHCNSHIRHYFLYKLSQQNLHIWKSNYQAIFQIHTVRYSSINLTAISLHDCHYGNSEGKVTPEYGKLSTVWWPYQIFGKFFSVEMVVSFDKWIGNAAPLSIYPFYLNHKTMSCSGHFNWTVQWWQQKPGMPKVKGGDIRVPWFSSWLSFLCVNRITSVEVSKAAYCCTFIWQYPWQPFTISAM
jgi:hypothetical protein